MANGRYGADVVSGTGSGRRTWVGDGELVVDAGLYGGLDLVVAVVEIAAADRGGERGVVVEAECVQALGVRGLLLPDRARARAAPC